MALEIVYVGPRRGTCLQRARALESLGHRLRSVECGYPLSGWRYQLYRAGHHLHRPPDLDGANRALLRAVRERAPDLVWIDRGRTIRPTTLRAVRRLAPAVRILSYSPDDMMLRSHSSAQYLACVPLYDLHVTTKSYNVAELEALGARDVLFVDNAYEPSIHRPLPLTPAEHERFDCDVGFIGFCEEDRARKVLGLAEAGVRVTVRGWEWGPYQGRHPNLTVLDERVFGDDYARALCATRINLGFLRKAARDLQTTRSIEIPACGAFMLAERTDEHLRLFEEGVEAEFFDSPGELLAKCRYYLEHEAERARIAAAGLRRCREGGYSNAARIRTILDHLVD